MDLDITIKNFRCFSDTTPARIQIRDGFTALVGVNNSGKSALLKMFFELRDIFGRLTQSDEFLNALNTEQAFNLIAPVTDKLELFNNSNKRDITLDLSLSDVAADQHKSVQIRIPYNRNTFHALLPDLGAIPPNHKAVLKPNGVVIRSSDGVIHSTRPDIAKTISAICDAMRVLWNIIYIGAFRNAINIGTKEDYFDIPIGQSFIKHWRIYKSGQSKENNELAYRVTQDIAHLFGLATLEINPTDDDKSLHFFVNGQPFRLAERGSGIAQFIIVLASAAMKRPAFILIDEPELNLHPSLQLDFLTSLGSFASNGVIFTTHNIGLARASAERIYTTRLTNGVSEIRELESTPNLAEFLGEMSFSGYRELGVDKVLMVEGATEVKAVQQLLRLYGKDHKIVLLSLGGSDMINGRSEAELEEVKRISENVFAVIDSERGVAAGPIPADRKVFHEKCKASGIKCHVLERRALENYFPQHAVKKAMGESFAALNQFDALKNTSNGWRKRDNWRIAREMTVADLAGTDLEHFLKSL